ncbi:hypothetical protein NKH85_08675 [Mesorhizobium sp. M0924]|uniref:hypothetical protein n=1 Tax=unclassified Mesorhizobium TaxID=325217 RepID=UPI00333AF3AD
MSYDNDDWIKAITKLIELTSKEEVSWNLTEEYEEDVWTEVDRAYVATLKDFRYVVKSTRKKDYVDESEWYWTSGFSFEIYKRGHDLGFVRIASAPDLNIVSNLYSVVEDNFAYREGALKDLLGSGE